MKSTVALTVAVAALSAFASGCGGGSGGESTPPRADAAVAPSDPSSAVTTVAVATASDSAASAPVAASAASATAVATNDAPPAGAEPTARALATTTAADSPSTKTGSSTTAPTSVKLATTTTGTTTPATAQVTQTAVAIPAAAPAATAAPAMQATAQPLAAAPVAADFTTLLGRMRSEYLGLSAWQAPTAIPSLDAKGEWADINYDDRSIGEWKAMPHLERVRAMAIVYSATTGKYSKSAAVRDGVIRALRAWVARNPQSDNWWHNTIGAQAVLMPILVLMDAELPADLRSALLATFVPITSVPADRKTGQNLVWYAMQAVVKGALTRTGADVATGRDALHSTLVITTKEGLQADLSFQQHGNQLYSGGYGLSYLIDMVHMADWLKGTAWAFTNADMNLLADYATVGIGPLVRGEWLDWGARGREVTRQESVARATALRDPVRGLQSLAPDRSNSLTTLLGRLQTGTPPNATSTTGYWRSDFLAHQTPKGYFSVKMVSKRTIGTESGNGENLLGYWLPFGATFIVGSGSGREYLGLQPLLDWSALPGTTAPETVPSFNGYLRHSEDRVSVLSNPNNGMASMQVNTQGLLAKKLWFVDGEMMVALGADIRYTGSQRVRTTLNQTRWMGTANSSVGTVTSSAGNAAQSNVKSLAHAGVGYILLDDKGASLTVNERKLTGSDPTTNAFAALAATAKATQVMTLAIDHGTKPQAASYAYAIVHGIAGTSQLQAVARPKVLANTALAQGVMSADGARLAIAFHQPGQVALGNGLSLQADQAVSVLGQIVGSQLQLQVVDLAGNGGTVTLRTLQAGQTVGQQTLIAPSNTQRTRQTPAGNMTLVMAR
jgi:chondroitin AC lyase